MSCGPFAHADIPMPRRIAILRALKLGDLLCAVPAFRALRQAWPHAQIVLIGLPWAAEFVERYRDYLDDFREFPGYPGLPERPPQIERLPAFLAEIQSERFDLALQLHGSGSYVNSLTLLFGARQSAGFYLPGEWCPDPTWFLPYPERGTEVQRLLTLMRFLGIPAEREALEFPIRESDERLLDAILGESLPTGSFACLHPGASVAERRWPETCFAAVGDALARRGLRLVLTGTAGEAPLTASVRRHLHVPVMDLAGRTNLGTMAALLRRSRLLVCNDTGTSHLAAALQLPSVVISTGNNPERWAPADHRCHRVLTDPDGVRPAAVVRQIDELLRLFPATPDEQGVERTCDPCVC